MKKNASLFLIFLTVFIDLLGFGILIPILPAFAIKELGVSEFQVGIIVAVYSFVQFIFNPVFGKLSDRYGRRPLIIITLLLNAVGYLIFAYTHSFVMLIISRVVAGIGGSSIGVAQAYIADVTTKENRSRGMGLIGAAFGLGFVFGPPVGGILAKFGYSVIGFVSAGFSLLAFVTTIFALPESLKKETREKQSEKKLQLIDIKAFKSVFSHPDTGVLILLFFILTFSNANIYGTFPILGHKIYGFSDQQNGYIFGVMGIVSAAVGGGLRVIGKYLSEKRMVTFGALFMMVGLGMFPYGFGFWGLALICAVFSIGSGVLQPALLSIISKAASEKEQGFTLGVNQSVSAFARVLGPLWGGFSFQYIGYQFPFLTGAVFTFLIFMFSVSFLSKKLVIG